METHLHWDLGALRLGPQKAQVPGLLMPAQGSEERVALRRAPRWQAVALPGQSTAGQVHQVPDPGRGPGIAGADEHGGADLHGAPVAAGLGGLVRHAERRGRSAALRSSCCPHARWKALTALVLPEVGPGATLATAPASEGREAGSRTPRPGPACPSPSAAWRHH